ncbi:MAG: tyrosine-type recombinase/integrase [Verrucomicrobia bacterium]|nr:tyrosine-type recombinase/integrase [Verrucomicrobiota bacterium]
MPTQVLYHLRLFAKLDLWLLTRKQRLWELNEKKVDKFLKRLRAKHPTVCHGAPTASRLLLTVLRDIGVVAPKREPVATTPAERLANQYRVFLKQERGLDCATIYNYSRHVDRFLAEQFGGGRINLRALSVSDIGAFVRRHAPRHGRGWAAQMVTGLRSFFRFAQLQGVVESDLAALVPSVPSWEMSGPPKHLQSEAVQRVLSACDRSTVKGKRDYAILLLLARLGLRAGEIVALQLDDIDWANGELVVRSKKGDGWARLPLPMDVGRALERYLMVRPPSPYRNVFVRGYAPYTPFVASGPVSVLVRKAIERAGVKSVRTGAHIFRHSLATEMLRRGASLAEIGRVLRHRDPDSTAIYARVDLEALRELALPWPGGAR